MGVCTETGTRSDTIFVDNTKGTKSLMIEILVPGYYNSCKSHLMCYEFDRDLHSEGESVESLQPVVISVSAVLAASSNELHSVSHSEIGRCRG